MAPRILFVVGTLVAAVIVIAVATGGTEPALSLRPAQVSSATGGEGSRNDGESSPVKVDIVQPAPQDRRFTLDFDDDWCDRKELNQSGRALYWLKFREWRRSIGIFRDSDLVPYEGYEDNTLRQLGLQGDLLALETLYERMTENRDTFDDATELLYPALAYGSARAAVTLGLLHRLNADRAEDGSFSDEDIYRAMAYYEVAMLLGDVNGFTEGTTFLKGIRREFDASEKAKVSAMARETLAELRSEYGVDATPRPVPRTALNFNHRQVKRTVPESGYDGWGASFATDSDPCPKPQP